jgi:integrase
MKSAAHLQLITRNPCDGLGPKNVFHKEREVVRDFNEECVSKLLAGIEGSWLKIPVLLGITMGMRRGECLALTWSDVDLDAGSLKIDKNLLHLRSQSPIVKRPKRDRTRQAMMPNFLIVALRRHRGQQAAHRLQLGPAWEDNGLVCPNELGQRRSPNSLTNTFSVKIDQLGLPDITFHDLRHLNATLLLLAGVPDKVVAERLGHSDTRITRDLYQHVLPAMDEEAARKTDAFFRRVAGDG